MKKEFNLSKERIELKEKDGSDDNSIDSLNGRDNRQRMRESRSHEDTEPDTSKSTKTLGSGSDDICECGHPKWEHSDGEWDGTNYCRQVICHCKQFKPKGDDLA